MFLGYVGSSTLAIYIYDLLHELLGSLNDLMMWLLLST